MLNRFLNQRTYQKFLNPPLTILLVVLLVSLCPWAMGHGAVPGRDGLSLSLPGKETEGVTYLLKEITKNDDLLMVSILHQPNEKQVTLVDFSVYNNSDSHSEEWRVALLSGERLMGSLCQVTLLLPGEDQALRCDWEEGSRDGNTITSTFAFPISGAKNLEDATAQVHVAFYEAPEQENTAQGTLSFPLTLQP